MTPQQFLISFEVLVIYKYTYVIGQGHMRNGRMLFDSNATGLMLNVSFCLALLAYKCGNY